MTHQWTGVRNIVDLLARLGRDEQAAVLYGVVSSRTTAAPVFGADAQRLAVVSRLLLDRLGSDRLAWLRAQGAATSDDDCVAYVCDALDPADGA